MRFSNTHPSHLKRTLLLTACLGLLTIVSLPCTVVAGVVSSSGASFIDWNTLSLTLGGSSFDPGLFLDPVVGYSSGFSGSQVQLNATQVDVGNADYGTSLGTYSTASVSTGSSTATALSQTGAIPPTPPTTITPATGLMTSLNISVAGDTSGLPDGVPNQARANLYYFGFVAPAAGQLQVSVNYRLDNSLTSSDPNGFVTSNLFAGLLLYGYDLDGNPMNDPLTTATAELINSITGTGSTSSSSGLGTLTLSYLLAANTMYDLGMEVSSAGSASAAPIPPPLMLLGSGVFALLALKRSWKTVLNRSICGRSIPGPFHGLLLCRVRAIQDHRGCRHAVTKLGMGPLQRDCHPGYWAFWFSRAGRARGCG